MVKTMDLLQRLKQLDDLRKQKLNDPLFRKKAKKLESEIEEEKKLNKHKEY